MDFKLYSILVQSSYIDLIYQTNLQISRRDFQLKPYSTLLLLVLHIYYFDNVDCKHFELVSETAAFNTIFSYTLIPETITSNQYSALCNIISSTYTLSHWEALWLVLIVKVM
jgi:hypothetical protein